MEKLNLHHATVPWNSSLRVRIRERCDKSCHQLPKNELVTDYCAKPNMEGDVLQ